MKDGIIKADGTSRLARSVADFKTKYPTYDDFAAALVAGTLPLDILFNEAGWTQLPDFLNQANLLKESTAILYGKDGKAVPDDVLVVLSRFQNGFGNDYVWEKFLASIVTTGSTLSRTTGGAWIQYSAEAKVVNGGVQLVNPERVLLSGSTVAATQLAGKYFYFEDSYDGTMLKCYAATASGSNASVTYYKTTLEKDSASISYVNSPDPDAYPVDDGYAYTARGRLGGKSLIETGSYQGADKYGSSQKNSLTFSFVPKLLVIVSGGISSQNNHRLAVFPYGCNYVATKHNGSNSSANNMNVVVSGWGTNTIFWYHADSAQDQMDFGSHTYYYAVIG